MRRGNSARFPVAFLCLLAGLLPACGRPGPRNPHPSGLPLIAVSVSGEAVYLVDPATGDRRTLVDGLTDFRQGYGIWSPDHQEVAYAKDGISIANPRTDQHRVIVRGARLSMPAWDVDGTHLAYSDGLTLWLTSLGRVAPRRIHVPAILAPLDLAWSSTDLIAFEGVNLDCSRAVKCVSTGSSEIWTIRRDGTALHRATNVGHAEAPKWSPDGTKLLFIRRYPAAGKDTEVWISEPGATPRRLLAESGILSADWSPDGSMLAVIRTGEEAGSLELWVGNPDASGLRRLGEPFRGTHATIDW